MAAFKAETPAVSSLLKNGPAYLSTGSLVSLRLTEIV